MKLSHYTFGLSLAAVLATSGCRGPGDNTRPSSTQAPLTAAPAPAPTTKRPRPKVRGVVGHNGKVAETAKPAEPDEPEDHEAACAPQGIDVIGMQLQRFTWASAIEKRDPKDKLRVAKAGKRVYAHLRLRNRSGRKRCVKVKFRIGGKARPTITLKIGKSWSWRTWAYSTLKSDDRGAIELTITDDQGNVMVNERLPIVPG